MATARPYLKRNDTGAKQQFITLAGALQEQADQVEVIERPGIDGVAFRRTGKKAAATYWTGQVDVTTADAARQLVADLQALQGQYCELGDDIGNVYANVMVTRGQSLHTPRKIGPAAGGLHGNNGNYLVRFRFELKFTEV